MRIHVLLIGLIALLVTALSAGDAGAQQVSAWGPTLFSPSKDAGREIDTGRAIAATPFYQVPTLDMAAVPGTLIRAEPASDFDLPAGVTATRILYHTRTANNTDAIASGVVLVPYGRPPAQGWPLLAWSHGTSGVATGCAPSLMKSLFYNWEGLYAYVALGYAVVATDYVGLGTTGRHAYLDFRSNATDVIHSVTAAHAAVPSLGRRWLSIGHSQGGLAALGVAELEANIKDPDFLGTVALAGASDPQDSIDNALKLNLPVLNGLVAFWVYGAKTVHPELNVKDVLSDRALAIYTASVEDGCSAASGAFAVMPTGEMLKNGWQENRSLKPFLERNRPGMHETFGPILLIGGGDDVLFTQAASQKVVRRICTTGGHVHRRVYPGLAHDPVVLGSLHDQMDWIAERFAGKPAPDDCRALNEHTD